MRGFSFFSGFLSAFAALFAEVALLLVPTFQVGNLLGFFAFALTEEFMKLVFLRKTLERAPELRSYLIIPLLFALGFVGAEVTVFLLGGREILPSSFETRLFGFMSVASVHLGTILLLNVGLLARSVKPWAPTLSLILATIAHTLYNYALFR